MEPRKNDFNPLTPPFLLVVKLSFYLLAATVALLSCKSPNTKPVALNTLSPEEQQAGFKLLFDGKTLNGWKEFNRDTLSGEWTIEDSLIVCNGKGGDIGADLITVEQYENFELLVDWKISPQGNSGIFYHAVEDTMYHAAYYTAPEYQLIDDLGWPDELEEWQKTAADYAMHPAPSAKKLNPVGEWNSSKIIYNKGHVEHWLNGEKVVEFEAYTPEWQKLRDSGKWKDYPDYAISKIGHIGLQDHGSKIYFKNIKIKAL